MVPPRNWRPGSFTKNFRWGEPGYGLSQLHDAIHVAFDGRAADVDRDVARRRMRAADFNDLIPVNFFLLNRTAGRNLIVVDELVRMALLRTADRSFDKLAAFALNLSLVGNWRGARREQRCPAEWAKHFIASKVFLSGRWNGTAINAEEIEAFVASHPRYRGVWARKVATNLSYIFELAGLKELRSGLAEEWWGSAIFLALDRISVDRGWLDPWPGTDHVLVALRDEHVFDLTAVSSVDGMIAARGVVELYLDGGLPESTGGTAVAADLRSVPDMRLQAEKATLPVERIYLAASRQVRDRKLVASIRRLYRDKCAVCGDVLPLIGHGRTFAEVGHIKPVGKPFRGADHISNVLPFCPNHHRQFDRGAVYFEVDGGRARVVDRSGRRSHGGRVFVPAPGHPLDMANLRWHADYFLRR